MTDSSRSNYWRMDMERVIFFKANIGEGVWSEGLRKKFDLCPIRESNASFVTTEVLQSQTWGGREFKNSF